MAVYGEKLKSLRRDPMFKVMTLVLDHFIKTYGLTPEDILSSMKQSSPENQIPLTAFKNHRLSILEIIVKYLKENKGKTYHEIALLLNRDDRTIWATYNNALKKLPTRLVITQTPFYVPLDLFSSRKTSVLETLIIFLKDVLKWNFKDISSFLARDYQTIYTTYRRGKERNEK